MAENQTYPNVRHVPCRVVPFRLAAGSCFACFVVHVLYARVLLVAACLHVLRVLVVCCACCMSSVLFVQSRFAHREWSVSIVSRIRRVVFCRVVQRCMLARVV